ncbi:NAD-dependent epimerase/dehydratase [Lachnellula hyalina]|uniref:NAD-dependent epimerase/dehydratase n=1 Tax=Lachnellula hyalina TaxID=1316788 RepID=A0A8H8R229_9HELO|nr:NAD-dependent epimerase/dehydratase [Lachnellula hyalina]TVY26256.1 NAD-dependent epimerase/dehydratase [Lachnellula hyalina]
MDMIGRPSDRQVSYVGATGFIGFKVLLDALESGYNVRVAVRSSTGSEALLSNPKIRSLVSGNNISFVAVPDITQEGAYDEALKGVVYAIHVASPVPKPFFKDPQADIIQPTIKGAASLLASALKVPSLKRIVITSSIVANMNFPPVPTADETTAESRVPNYEGPIDAVFPAYCDSKIATLNATDKFVKEQNPSFDVINIFPGFVHGRNELATDVARLRAGSAGLLLAIILGQIFEVPRIAVTAHVDDVAKVYLLALSESVQGGQGFGISVPAVFDDAFDFVKKASPKAVDNGVFKKGSQPGVDIAWNASKTESAFGFKFQSYKTQVLDVAGQYLEFLGEEKA